MNTQKITSSNVATILNEVDAILEPNSTESIKIPLKVALYTLNEMRKAKGFTSFNKKFTVLELISMRLVAWKKADATAYKHTFPFGHEPTVEFLRTFTNE